VLLGLSSLAAPVCAVGLKPRSIMVVGCSGGQFPYCTTLQAPLSLLGMATSGVRQPPWQRPACCQAPVVFCLHQWLTCSELLMASHT
jgi:hypothetical protein